MRIRTRLNLSAGLFIVVIAGLIAVQEVASRRVEALLDRRNVIEQVVQGVFELNLLLSDYLLHGERRAREQWSRRHASLSSELDRVRPVVTSGHTQLEQMRTNLAAIKTQFAEVTQFQATGRALTPREELIVAQLLLSSQSLVSSAKVMASRATQAIQATQETARLVQIGSGSVAAIVIVLIVVSLARSIGRPLQVLEDGAAKIGQGDLDYRIGSLARDEFGDLSRAFDRMSERLQAVTVSRDDLVREVKERERAERRAQQSAAALERSNRELEQFAYIASHDLQEPLRKVQMFVDRLQVRQSDQLTDQGKDYLQRILSATARMRQLVDSLLALSRISNTRQKVETVDLNVIAQEAVANLEVRMEETGGSVELGPLPTIQGNPLQLGQLLQNLIGNALKFHPKDRGTRVEVTAIRGHTHDETGANDDEWVLCVKDDGIGIEEQYLERVFGPFTRLHGRSEYDGSGMGLTISRKIAERHGGRISVESTFGAGSIFKVHLPDAGHHTLPAEETSHD